AARPLHVEVHQWSADTHGRSRPQLGVATFDLRQLLDRNRLESVFRLRVLALGFAHGLSPDCVARWKIRRTSASGTLPAGRFRAVLFARDIHSFGALWRL